MTRADASVRLGLFCFTAVIAWVFVPTLLLGVNRDLDPIVLSALTTLVAGFAANLISSRYFESGHFRDFGLGWSATGVRQLLWGIALGAGSVGLLALGAVLTGLASFEPESGSGTWSGAGLTLLLVVLLFLGALGEELLFRGYLFQYFVKEWSALGTIVTTGVLFGAAHLLLNANINPLGAWNTALWGALFGFAYWRSQALWLPSGLHFGWNLGLVLIGVPLSGITIRVTGFGLHWSAGSLLSGGEYGPEGGVLASVLAAGLFLLLKRGR